MMFPRSAPEMREMSSGRSIAFTLATCFRKYLNGQAANVSNEVGEAWYFESIR